MSRLVLASSSPRRIGYLKALGIDALIDPANIDESIDRSMSAEQAIMTLAMTKARTVGRRHPNECILAADTDVVLDHQVLGKPGDRAEAISMLGALSGQTHRVLTAFFVIYGSEQCAAEIVETQVRISSLDLDQIEEYVDTGEPMDKAGAYGIQGAGAAIVTEIDGCYTNVAGLPLCRVTSVLQGLGIYPGKPIICGHGLDKSPPSVPQRRALG